MDDKDCKDMTASELLRWVATDENVPAFEFVKACTGKPYSETSVDEDRAVFNDFADKIDAELAQARGEALLQGAQVWAKANGWPDFKPGEDFSAWLDRCALPRPRFEDGEPVQSSDMEEIGALATCCVYMDGSWEFEPDKYEDERNPKSWDVQSGAKSERVKRPAPEKLGADGKPIVVGETVWNIFSGIEGIVKALNVNGESTAYVEWSDGRWSPSVLCDRLTHTPPDTQERIDEDAKKHYCTYFGGYSACGTCPASTDGLWGNHCEKQQLFDLLRRQRELDRRTGGE